MPLRWVPIERIPPIVVGGLHVKTRSRVLRAGFGSASADKFLSESVRILAERLTQSELVLRLCLKVNALHEFHFNTRTP